MVQQLTMAHEVGHSWGAYHDSEADCAPGSTSTYGNYLMYPSSTDGSRYNNDKFSPCSVSSIAAVVAKATCAFAQNAHTLCKNWSLRASSF